VRRKSVSVDCRLHLAVAGVTWQDFVGVGATHGGKLGSSAKRWLDRMPERASGRTIPVKSDSQERDECFGVIPTR
jgi:hypothetical protein